MQLKVKLTYPNGFEYDVTIEGDDSWDAETKESFVFAVVRDLIQESPVDASDVTVDGQPYSSPEQEANIDRWFAELRPDDPERGI